MDIFQVSGCCYGNPSVGTLGRQKECQSVRVCGKMVTSCCVVSCQSRHDSTKNVRFYRFPSNSERRELWVRALRRVAPDGSPWRPGPGDRVCSKHFVTVIKNDDPLHVDFVPSIALGYENDRREASRSVARLERSHRRSSVVEAAQQASSAEERQRKAFDEHVRRISIGITKEHSYAAALDELLPDPMEGMCGGKTTLADVHVTEKVFADAGESDHLCLELSLQCMNPCSLHLPFLWLSRCCMHNHLQ